MALTRAQLLSGNNTQGVVLPGQVQAVTAGAGVTISPTGILSVNPLDPLFNAFLRTNSTSAFNAYVWPIGGGTAGQQLTSDGVGNLYWSNASGIPWTTKGQLVVGTGINTDTILNAGVNTAVLMADSTTTSGLRYSNTSTTALQSPAGNTAARPNPATAGQFRFNTDLGAMEVYTGTGWVSIGAPIQAGLGINLSGTSPNEVYKLDVPVQFGPPAAGTLPAEAIDGSLYWDDNLGIMFIRYNDGTSTQWVQVIPTGGGGGGTGTVTSVAVSGTNGISVVSGSPVTSAGTIALTINVSALPPIP